MMTIPAQKEFTLFVWTRGSHRATTYHILGRPLLATCTNDVAIQFDTIDGKELIISSNCEWTLIEK